MFLERLNTSFTTIHIISRNVSSQKAQELATKGGELRSLDEPLDKLLADTNVVVNCLPTRVPNEYKTELTKASVRHGVKVFFMSEFGLYHGEWRSKRVYVAETRALTKGTKTRVIALYTGTFLEMALEPYLGIDIKANRYIALENSKTKFAFTSEYNIGCALVQLSILALNPKTSASVPEEICIAGENVNYQNIRDGEIIIEDLAAHKKLVQERKAELIFDFVRVVHAEGKADFSQDNGNELVNPRERLWKWKTVEDQLREM
ncbi:hypothetical protein C8Q80DRAFT_1326916 [Daedaleopsis nitida]|nr:hypothetical protein C8Q80DRAFT_1326916 [Daedaleopsis nitida]